MLCWAAWHWLGSDAFDRYPGGNAFEAASAAIAAFRQEGWSTEALTANAIPRVEVQLPPVFVGVLGRRSRGGLVAEPESIGRSREGQTSGQLCGRKSHVCKRAVPGVNGGGRYLRR